MFPKSIKYISPFYSRVYAPSFGIFRIFNKKCINPPSMIVMPFIIFLNLSTYMPKDHFKIELSPGSMIPLINDFET